MHPVESTIYLSSALFPALFVPQHPVHFLFKKFYTSISPIGGHDGFDQPGGGSFIHYLHHAHFNCTSQASPRRHPAAQMHRRYRIAQSRPYAAVCGRQLRHYHGALGQAVRNVRGRLKVGEEGEQGIAADEDAGDR